MRSPGFTSSTVRPIPEKRPEIASLKRASASGEK